ERSAGVTRDHSSKARPAAATASSTSPVEARSTLPRDSPVEGSRRSISSPADPVRTCPSMSWYIVLPSPSGDGELEVVPGAGEAVPVVVRPHHPGRGLHPTVSAAPDRSRWPEDELARAAVAVARCHVVEEHLRDPVGLGPHDRHADGLVPGE